MNAEFRPRRRIGAPLALLAVLCLSCSSEDPEEITLQVGPEQVYRFKPESGFAHYYELPGQDDLLRIILASYPLGCQDYRSPEPGDVFVTVSLRVPAPGSVEPSDFPWKGLSLSEDSEDNDDNEAKAPEPSALPFVRLAEDARALPPGGGVKLKEFEAETFGRVQGELAFRDAAQGQAANTALIGNFDVRLCHLQLDPARRSPPKKD